MVPLGCIEGTSHFLPKQSTEMCISSDNIWWKRIRGPARAIWCLQRDGGRQTGGGGRSLFYPKLNVLSPFHPKEKKKPSIEKVLFSFFCGTQPHFKSLRSYEADFCFLVIFNFHRMVGAGRDLWGSSGPSPCRSILSSSPTAEAQARGQDIKGSPWRPLQASPELGKLLLPGPPAQGMSYLRSVRT